MKPFLTLIAFVGVMSVCVAQTVSVELNLEKGATYSQQSSSTSIVKQSYAGQDIEMTINLGGKMSFKVLTVTNTGYDVEAQYERLYMTMDMPTGTMEYSSDNAAPGDIMSGMFAAMMHRPFQMTITRHGKVTEIRNMSNLFEGAFEKYELTDEQKQQVMASLSQSFGEEALKGNLEMTMAVFPTGPVAVGGTWTTETELRSTMQAAVKTTYKLDAIEGDYYVISGKSEIRTKVNTDPSAPMTYDMTGTMTSRIKLAKKTGWISDGSYKQSISGKAVFPDNPQMPGGMEVPMSIDGEVLVADK